jgi:hypothetical protein
MLIARVAVGSELPLALVARGTYRRNLESNHAHTVKVI